MSRLLGSTVLHQRVKQTVKAKVTGKDKKYKSTSKRGYIKLNWQKKGFCSFAVEHADMKEQQKKDAY